MVEEILKKPRPQVLFATATPALEWLVGDKE